jgi:hypothetical protein
MPLTTYPINRVCSPGVIQTITLQDHFLTLQWGTAMCKHWCDNLCLITGAIPLASGLRTRGPAGLRPTSYPQPPLGDLRHLCLLAKLDKHFFWVNESVTNRKPDSRGSLRVPFTQSQRLAPNMWEEKKERGVGPTGFWSFADIEIGIRFNFSNPFPNYKPIWIQIKFEFWMILIALLNLIAHINTK